MTNEMDAEAMTDGFHLVVDALKLNGIDTVYGVAGIPITDLARLIQAEGLRYIGFRHEQAAGNAAAISGMLAWRACTSVTRGRKSARPASCARHITSLPARPGISTRVQSIRRVQGTVGATVHSHRDAALHNGKMEVLMP